MRRPLAAALAFLLLLGGCAALDRQQREWIFQPTQSAWAAGLAAAEGMQDVWIDFDSQVTGASARLHALWLPQARPDAPTLLYLHGARWDVRGSAPRMRRLHDLGFAVLGVDYRGFGRSEGGELPSEAMAYEDARAAWDWLKRERPPGTRRRTTAPKPVPSGASSVATDSTAGSASSSATSSGVRPV